MVYVGSGGGGGEKGEVGGEVGGEEVAGEVGVQKISVNTSLCLAFPANV